MKGTNFEIRPARPEEMAALLDVPDYAFAINEPRDPDQPLPIEPEWTLCAFDGGRPVATSGQYPFKMRFNGNAVRADGVTLVSTDPGYRRRGLLRQLIGGLLAQSKAEGAPVSILWASMGAIYQRFGYGLAGTAVEYDVHPRFVRFQFGEPASGDVRLLDADAARPALNSVYRGYSADATLLLHRNDALWQRLYRPRGRLKTHTAVYFDSADRPTAYCIYRSRWQELENVPEPDQMLEVLDFTWIDIEGYRGIWQYLAGHDLANRIRWYRVPEDDPAPVLFLEPRMLSRRTGDGIWLRVVDAELALESRGYDLPGEATLRLVEDELCEWNVGRFRLTSDGSRATVQRLGDGGAADLVLGPGALAGLVSGHTRASSLVRMGRAASERPERLPELDALFSTRRRPTCANMF